MPERNTTYDANCRHHVSGVHILTIKKIFATLACVFLFCCLPAVHGNCRRRDDDIAWQQCRPADIEEMKRDDAEKFRDFQYALRHIRTINRKQKAHVSCAVAKALADHVHWERYRFASQEHRLNFLSVLIGIIGVESAFDPGAVSCKNARGLMQVHWPTWKRYFTSIDEAHNLHKNLHVGAGILRLYMRQSNNNLRRALYKYLGAKDDRYADMVIEGAITFKKSVLVDPAGTKDERKPR